jgi:hypothetical protein
VRTPRWLAPVLLVLGAVEATTTHAVELMLDRLAIEQALAIGQSRPDRDRARFHAPYRLTVDRAPIDYIDIVTPFRRLVLAAEQRTRVGDRSFGQRQAMAMVAATPGQVDLRIELTFHPMNAYVGVPGYDVELQPATGPATQPQRLDRVPRFGPRVDGTPLPAPSSGALISDGGQPMLGGTVIASFDGRLLTGRFYEVVVSDKGQEIVRTGVALGGMR